VGFFARRFALRKNRRLSRTKRNGFQITARVFSVTQRRHTLRVSIELAINQLANQTRQARKQLAVKVSVILPRVGQAAFAVAVAVNLLIVPKVSAQAIAPAHVTTGATAEVERVIVTGSNIPTAEETGPNPVDTYRPADIEKLGIRNATDLTTFLPQQSGATTNLNIGNGGGDGTVQFNLRGLLSKETLVLVDGKRVAFGSLNAVGFSGGVDINLIPFPMIDHIDILKDGASAVYGSDAITGVVQLLFVTQIPWVGDRGKLREHKPGSFQRHG
jgi:outer membrane receptor protein involved in Fe transport